MVAEHFYEPIPEHTPEEEIAKLFRTIKEGTKTMQEANPDFKIDTLGHFDVSLAASRGRLPRFDRCKLADVPVSFSPPADANHVR